MGWDPRIRHGRRASPATCCVRCEIRLMSRLEVPTSSAVMYRPSRECDRRRRSPAARHAGERSVSTSVRRSHDHALAATQCHIGDGGLEGHRPGQSQRVAQRGSGVVVGPEAAATQRRPPHRGMDRDDAVQAGALSPANQQLLMIERLEVGAHAVQPTRTLISCCRRTPRRCRCGPPWRCRRRPRRHSLTR